jgi:hypothetical protein
LHRKIGRRLLLLLRIPARRRAVHQRIEVGALRRGMVLVGGVLLRRHRLALRLARAGRQRSSGQQQHQKSTETHARRIRAKRRQKVKSD